MDQFQRKQLESAAREGLRNVVVCRGCKQIYGYKPEMLVNKPVDDWLIKVGIHCPKCGLFHRGYWMNTALIELRVELGERPNRKGARRFSHAFKKFQNRMRLKTNVGR